MKPPPLKGTRSGIGLRPTSRWFARALFGSPWLLALAFVYIAVVTAVSMVSLYTPVTIKTCMFRAMTDKPCGGCGATRMVFRLFEGKPIEAFLLNPFMFIVFSFGVNLLLLKVLFKRRIEFRVSGRVWWLLGALLFAAFLGNWWYVWNYVG